MKDKYYINTVIFYTVIFMKRFHKEIGKDVRIGVRILHLITNKYTCVNKYIIDCNNYNNHIIKLSFCISTSNYITICEIVVDVNVVFL